MDSENSEGSDWGAGWISMNWAVSGKVEGIK